MPNLRGQRKEHSSGQQNKVGEYPQTNGSASDPASAGKSRGGRQGSSFAARFGRVILGHGIAALPSALLHFQGQMGLSAQQVWFVLYVLSHKWDEDLPYPSLKKMARATGLSLSQVQRIKNSICQLGLLEVYPRFGDKDSQQSNAYDFSELFNHLEEAIAANLPHLNLIRAEGDGPSLAELGEIDSSFVARYGRVITKYGVAAVPRAIFTHQAALNLTPQQVWFVTYIFSFQWDTGLPYPSIRRMAAQTGYSSVQLHNIKSELVEAGLLRLVHRTSEEGGQDTNAYDFSGLLDRIRALLQPAPTDPKKGAESKVNGTATMVLPPRRGRGLKPKRDRIELSRGDRNSLSEVDSARKRRGDRIELSGRDRKELTVRDRSKLSGGDSSGLPEDGSARLAISGKPMQEGGTSGAYQRGVAPSLHEVETGKEEKNKEEDSSNRSTKKNGSKGDDQKTHSTAALPYSPYIAAIISDFSVELDNTQQVVSNVTQALRLWQQSGLPEEEFTELLYEAKRRLRAGQGRQGAGGISNKMAYFFTTLREVCREAAQGPN